MSDVKEASQSARNGVVLQNEVEYLNFKSLRESESFETLSPEEQGSIQAILDNYKARLSLNNEDSELLSQ